MGNTYVQALYSPFFILLILLIGWQYSRMRSLSDSRGTTDSAGCLKSTVVSVAAGLIGGFVGSFLLIFFGVDLSDIGVIYLFFTALLLMLVQARFLCFAYAGGLLSLLHLLFGFPDIDVSQVMALVAILHMIESLLIFFTGSLDPAPVYVRHNDQIVGGFNLQKFWPLPLVALVSGGMLSIPVSTDAWWPILTQLCQNENLTVILPFWAVLGYGEVTTTAQPAVRARTSAAWLALFSVVLLGLALLGAENRGLLYLAALFGPLGHELVIWLNLRAEYKNQPLYCQPEQGLLVLDTVAGSPARKAGLKSRDIILTVNGIAADTRDIMDAAIRRNRNRAELLVIRQERPIHISFMKRPNEADGMITVPGSESHLRLDHSFAAVFLQLFFRLKRGLP